MKKILNLNVNVIFLKTIKHALNRFLHGAIQLMEYESRRNAILAT